jgi:hypothetical protein
MSTRKTQYQVNIVVTGLPRYQFDLVHNFHKFSSHAMVQMYVQSVSVFNLQLSIYLWQFVLTTSIHSLANCSCGYKQTNKQNEYFKKYTTSELQDNPINVSDIFSLIFLVSSM